MRDNIAMRGLKSTSQECSPLTDAINKCFEQDIERLTLGGCDALVEKENVKAPISVATVEKDDGDPEAL